jgi:hypothetical protein
LRTRRFVPVRDVLATVALVVAAGGCRAEKSTGTPNPFHEDGGQDGADDGGGETSDGGEDTTTDGLDDGPSTATTPTSADPDDGAPESSEGTSTGDGSGEETLGLDDTSTSAGETAATGESGDSYGDGTIEVTVVVTEMWESGECDDVTVTNVSAGDVMWEVELELPGTIYNLWNANIVEMDGVGTFTGVDFNATIGPDESAMFGFCVNY